MSTKIHNIIGNEIVASKSERTSPVFNPAIGEQTGVVALSMAAEVADAIAAAKDAFPAWSNTPPLKRARMMFRFKELLDAHIEDIAHRVSAEQGKTHDDALGEIARGIEVVEFACGIPHLMKGDFSRNVGPAIDIHSERRALGVCAGITPFNFPAMVPMWMYPVSVACGNTFVLKPSEKVPSTSNFIMDLFIKAGFPSGVLNVVHGDKEAVDALLTHPDVKAVSFVGSTPIAEYVYATACAHGKRVQALGGAKNHMVIMPDADMDKAADALMGAGYGAAGERCMAVSVAVPVGEKTADRLIESLAPMVRSLKIGTGTDPQSEMGPLISRQHLEKVTGYIDRGVAQGAELIVDGRGLILPGYENGYFIGGTLFDRVGMDMSIYTEEIFGPVLCVVRAPDFACAVSMVNDHEYGNGATIFTRDGDTARSFADSTEVGMIGINVPIPVPVAYHSFGGWKRSIFGAHGIYGPEGIHFNTRLKTVTSRWPAGIKEGASFALPTMN